MDPRKTGWSSRRWWALSVVTLLALVWHVSPSMATAEGDPRPPNILFLLSDDQRPDTLSALGNPHLTTPFLDRLAKEGTTFTRAVCANPLCVPSRLEILTGCSGFRNGVLGRPGDELREDVPRWATTFSAHGYRCAYVGKWHTAGRPSEWGYGESLGLFSSGGGRWWESARDWKGSEITGYRGWVFQSDDRDLYPQQGIGLTPDISAKFADAAIEFLETGEDDRPFFLHVNFTAPHDPLLLPAGQEAYYQSQRNRIPVPGNFLARHPFEHGNLEGRDEKLLPWPRDEAMVADLLAMYYAVIQDLDRQIGRILEALETSGRAERTVVIFASDHGMGVGSHGLRGKQNQYEHTLRVPLILAGPGIPRDETRQAQVYLRDLFPTACEWAGIAVPEAVEGRSLVPVIEDGAVEVYSEIFGYFRDSQRSICDGRWKLIRYPQIDRVQLFDLENDPLERIDLSEVPTHAPTRERLGRRLAEWRRSVGDSASL